MYINPGKVCALKNRLRHTKLTTDNLCNSVEKECIKNSNICWTALFMNPGRPLKAKYRVKQLRTK